MRFIFLRQINLYRLLIIFLYIPSVLAEEKIEFNPFFIKKFPGQAHIDLNLFSQNNRVLPGNYLTDIYINKQYIEQLNIRFDNVSAETVKHRSSVSTNDAIPCLNKTMLARWGIDLSYSDIIHHASDHQCISLTEAIAFSEVRFDIHQQKLHISIPQVALKKTSTNDISPTRWNKGINAARLNYQLITTQSSTTNKHYSSAVIDSGMNINGWRLRHRSNYLHSQHHQRWQTLELNAQRDIAAWYSTLTIGDLFTAGNVFNSVALHGIQINSDQSMLPYSQQGYAPIIRGLAQTNATVTIKQNGYVIYTTLVAPGPFVINDFVPTSSQGNLEIIVAEADGRISKTIQPYAIPAMQLRQGDWRYQAAVGKYRARKNDFQNPLAQGAVTYGINNTLTTYGGVQISNGYYALANGYSMNLENYGAITLGAQHVQSKNHLGLIQHGQQYQLQYTKAYIPTRSYFQFNVYHSPHPTFRTFTEYVEHIHYFIGKKSITPKTRLEYSISQQLGDGNINAQLQTYLHWHGKKDHYVQLSYHNHLKALYYSIYYIYRLTKPDAQSIYEKERLLSLSLTLPLDSFFKRNYINYINYNTSSNLNDSFNQSISSSGYLTENQQLSYTVTAQHDTKQGKNCALNLQAQTRYANLQVNHSQSSHYQSTSSSLAGGMVIHQDGITLSPPLAETVALIKAPDAQDISIADTQYIKTNKAGYAVLPYANPYRKNRITLDTENLQQDIEIKNPTIEIIPTKGAIVLAEYETRRGYKVLISAQDQSGKPLPFGAYVEDRQSKVVGVVGMQGKIYLTGANSADTLTVKLGQQNKQACTLSYQIHPTAIDKNIQQVKLYKINSICSVTRQ